MRLFKTLRRKLYYLEPDQIALIHQAYLVASQAHTGQKRSTGEDYITHPVAVSGILAEMKMDYQTIISALLHDVIEDTSISKQDLIEQFGEPVAELVDGVSKLTKIEFVSRAQRQAENFRKMLLAMAKDIRVILIKLADRLHNMRTLSSLHSKKRRRIAQETLEIYAPIAKRLGMRDMSVELEEIGFQNRYPHRYRVLKEAVHKARGNRKKMLNTINKSLKECVEKHQLNPFAILGREKHLYSIYRKMRDKQISFNEIMDVYAFRIVVDQISTCYLVLGMVHGIFKPVPERFKDYIAIPKANGYQSLHTTLFGPYGLPIEIQIRTTEMDRMATSGIAAHWLYKTHEDSLDETHLRAQQWVRNLLELQHHAGNSLEFIENVKVDLFPDEIYVFTPKGDIMQLPANATAIDFAYAVHTDVGNASVAVKINHQFAPLSSVLSNGQTLEVITSETGRPSPAWLEFVVTSKAKSGIRHFIKNQKHADSIHLGKQLLKKALASFSMSLRKLSPKTTVAFLETANLSSMNDLFAEIGLGNQLALLVAQKMVKLQKKSSPTEGEENKNSPLVIKGTEGMMLDFSSCCHPIPKDPIVGIVNANKGISVHVEQCEHIAKLRYQSDQCVPLCWAENVAMEFPVVIVIEVINQRGILAMMAAEVSHTNTNIDDISVIDEDGKYYLVTFKLSVRNREHLAKVLKRLRHIQPVNKIVRK